MMTLDEHKHLMGEAPSEESQKGDNYRDERSKLKQLGFALKNGGKALKRATVRIQHPKTMKLTTSVLAAGNGKAYTTDGLHDMMVMIAGDIEKAYAEYEYELIDLGRGQFNFMCRGLKAKEAADGN